MALHQPPAGRRQPNHVTLPPGTRIFRVHFADVGATVFKTRGADSVFGGGRFDAMVSPDPYPFLYAGGTAAAAIAEVFLRSVPAIAGCHRAVPATAVQGRALSELELTEAVEVISLEPGQDLAVVGQDQWLVGAEPAQYAQTRAWARYLRRCSTAAGIVWQPPRVRPDRAVVLFGDRCPAGLLRTDVSRTVDFRTPQGLAWLNQQLAPHRAGVLAPALG